jgi:serine/threonine protein kinase
MTTRPDQAAPAAPRARYRLLEKLGQGGFAAVYRAELLGPCDFRREVAVKLLLDHRACHPEHARRLRDEARLLGRLQHPAIVQALDLVQASNGWAIVMEYVPGQDLGALLQRSRPPVGACLELAAEVADALHAAYRTPDGISELGVVHRDIKPQNLMITTCGRVKVLDFGGARSCLDGREARTTEAIYGSPRYLAPERLEWRDGPEGDVYSLGVTLAECLLGAPPTADLTRSRQGALLASLSRRLREAQPAIQPPLAQQICAFIAALCDPEPDARPTAGEAAQRAGELRRAVGGPGLREWVRSQPTSETHPVRLRAPPAPRARRPRLVALLASALLAASGLGWAALLALAALLLSALLG